MFDKNFKLSQHFKLGELTQTSYDPPYENEPTVIEIKHLEHIYQYWLEPLRRRYNICYVLYPHEDYETSPHVEGIVINQGFRSMQVSEAMARAGLKPSPTSNHLRGCAVDIWCAGVEQALRYMTILLDMSDQNKRLFDELILERRKNVYWIHFAVRPQGNRRKIDLMKV